MPLKQHIAARHHHRLGRQMRIISDEKTALAGIDVFIGLAGIAPDGPMPPRWHAIPRGPHGMGTVLDHCHARRITHGHQPVHVTDMAAHMAEQQDLGLIQLGLKVVQINRQAFGNTDKDWHSPYGGNRPRNRCKRERIAEHVIAMLHAHRTQGRGHGIAARGHRKAILRANGGCKFLLQQGRLRRLSRGGVVAMQATMAQHGQSGLDPGLGDRVLLGEAAGKCLCHGSSCGARPAPRQDGRDPFHFSKSGLSNSARKQSSRDRWQGREIVQQRLRLQRGHVTARWTKGDQHRRHARSPGRVAIRVTVPDQNAGARVAAHTARGLKERRGIGLAHRQSIGPDQTAKGVPHPQIAQKLFGQSFGLVGADADTITA
mmetsp:Transcript_22718/g.37524  ORF Transcript_22718/g.37524 Transcript_22718/m.37524 type:complete len:373 (-) Transcript_22718:435-1553(-)